MHFDLTDVVAHASSNRSLTGIQRVQIEYARVLAGEGRGQVNVFANLYGAPVDLDGVFHNGSPETAEAIFMRLRRLFGPPPRFGRPHWTLAAARSIGARRVRSAASIVRHALAPSGGRFGARDCLYVGGAFWAHPRSVTTYERAVRDGCDLVVLFHDVLPIADPELADSGCRRLFERMLRLRTRLLTVSRHSQAQIELARRSARAPSDLSPATVIPMAHEFSAAPRNFVARDPPSGRIAALERLGPFVLCVGTIEARKNQLPLVGLWQQLAREAGPTFPRLVMAGKRGWRAEEPLGALKRANAACPYAWVDAPTDEELTWLYSRARFTVFPSLAEGWGLPIGESLWFGKPCVASNAASMPEVGGALCQYGEPRAIDSFAPPVLRLIRDEAFYNASVAAIQASKLTTWAKSARALLQAVSRPSSPAETREAWEPPRRDRMARSRS